MKFACKNATKNPKIDIKKRISKYLENEFETFDVNESEEVTTLSVSREIELQKFEIAVKKAIKC